MSKNSFLKAIFSGPKFSLAPIEENNRGTLTIGKIIPVWSTILNPREGVDLNMSHLVRFLPAKAPVMEGYKVTFDAFAVPYSCLGYAERKERDIDDFFNIKENAGNTDNPFCFPMSRLGGMLASRPAVDGQDRTSLANAFKLGSLCDYVNFPSLKNVRDHVRKWLVKFGLVGDMQRAFVVGSGDYAVSNFLALALINHPDLISDEQSIVVINNLPGSSDAISLMVAAPFSTNLSIIPSDNNVTSDIFYTESDGTILGSFSPVRSLLGYILENYPLVTDYFGLADLDPTDSDTVLNAYNHLLSLETLDYLQVLYDNYRVDAQSIYSEYFEYVMSLILYNSELVNNVGDKLYSFASAGEVQETGSFLPTLSDNEPIDLSYLSAYWKIISDWYINTNIDGDPEDFFLEHCHLLTDNDLSARPVRYVDTEPFTRRWSNDIFTSCVPMAQVNNVRIPADGTIPDLREANAYQKLVDIFRNTGSRLRDVVYGIFGITPSAVRSEMSEPIGSFSTWIGMQSVLQTSQTTEVSPQAAYAGIGTDSGGFKRILKYVNNAEPTPVIIMVLMSVTQRASYMQGFDRKFFRKSIYDFAIPELAMIGEQELNNKEVYFDKDYESGVFGFNRRYYDWFYSGSQVHGDLRDTLDYWHGARIFDEQPYLNSEFIGIESDVDHLQRIFANISEASQPIVYNLSFDGYKTVALPRYIQYEL